MDKTIRIRTTVGGEDKYIKVKLDQEFDFLEVLSLRLSQEDVYKQYDSDYGVIIGRVTCNGSGFGIPNARVSIFIPLSDDDENDPLISSFYPYKSVTDKDDNGVRYNLLPKYRQNYNKCHQPVGTYSAKREILDNDISLEIYEKYYKFTTSTNNSGDYMIFGVPTGEQIIHFDVDLSDIGLISQKPYDFIRQGYPKSKFESPTKFKKDTNLDNLVHIVSRNSGITVLPFWGSQEDVGINRVDFDIPYILEPSAFFIGSIFGDTDKNSVNKHCRPRKDLGDICQQTTGEGTIEILRKTMNGAIEEAEVGGGRLIDENGAWAFMVPMNLDYIVTDEFGNIIPSEDPSKGLPTRSRVRMRIGIDQSGGEGRLATRANFIVPNNPETFDYEDYLFSTSVEDKAGKNRFYDMLWNKIYTVRNFIPRVQKRVLNDEETRHFIGIKNVNDCNGFTSFPYNRIDTKANPLFTMFCILISVILIPLVASINRIVIGGINTMISILNVLFNINYVACIGIECDSNVYAPGCGNHGADAMTPPPYSTSSDDLNRCYTGTLAESYGVFKLDFYNDWVNGTLYAFLLKYKRLSSGSNKFCNMDDSTYTNEVIDTCGFDDQIYDNVKVDEGLIYQYIDENDIKTLYYASISPKDIKLFATDITCLGGVNDCDIDGYPILYKYLSSTSYMLPPLLTENDSGDVVWGMIPDSPSNDGLFFKKLSCTKTTVNSTNCRNLRLQCEVGRDFSSTYVIDANTIANSYLRDGLVLINTNGNTYEEYRNFGGLYGFGDPYVSSTNFPSKGAGLPMENSYFFYFGLMPGKTAYDRLRNEYLTDCNVPKEENFFISYTTSAETYNTSGSINIIIYGANPQFDIIWSGPISSSATTGNQNYIIGGLVGGIYTITIIEINTSKFIKQIIAVGGPMSLSFTTNISNVTYYNANDGIINVYAIIGGVPPYTVDIGYGPAHIVNNQGGSTIFNNLPADTYIVTVTDDIGTIVSETDVITQPSLLTLSVKSYANISCNGGDTGTLELLPSGGVTPYTILVTYPDGFTTSTSFNNYNLFVGTYSGTVTDFIGQTATITKTLTEPTLIIFSISLGGGQIDVSVTGGDGPYDFSINNGFTYKTGYSSGQVCSFTGLPSGPYTILCLDNNGCSKYSNTVNL